MSEIPVVSHRPSVGHTLSVLPSLLRQLPAGAQERIKRASRVCAIRKGSLAFHAGATTDEVLIVQSGWAAVERDGVVVSLLPANSLFCLSIGKAERISECDLRAVSSGVSVCFINKQALWAALAESPTTMVSIMDLLVGRMAQGFESAARNVKEPLESRLKQFLWSVSTPVEQGVRLVPCEMLEIPQSVIASFLGAAREEISRKKQILQKEGVVFTKGCDTFIRQEPSAPQTWAAEPLEGQPAGPHAGGRAVPAN